MLSYQPDSTELNPDILTSASQLIPHADGTYRLPYAVSASTYAAPPVTPISCFLARNPDGTQRLFIASTTKVYEGAANAWTDRSESAGTYAVSAGWHFLQYGTDTYICNKANLVQRSTTGAFATILNLKALCMDTLEGAIAFWNVNDGTDKPDTIVITDIDNPLVIVPDTTQATLAYTNTLNECPGAGTAIIRFRNFLVIFKARGMWLAQFVGAPKIWDIQLYSADVGCSGKDACIVANDILYFVDSNNAWQFDGATLQSISDPVFVTKSLVAGAPTKAHFDDINKTVSFYAGFTYWPFNIKSRQWGKADSTQFAGVGAGDEVAPSTLLRAPASALTTFGGLGVTAASNENRVNFGKYDSLDPVGVGARYVQNGHGHVATGVVTTAFFGAHQFAQLMRRIYVSVVTLGGFLSGSTVTVTARRSPFVSGIIAPQSTSSGSVSSDEGYIDVMCRGNFFQITYTFTQFMTMTGWKAQAFDMIPVGKQ